MNDSASRDGGQPSTTPLASSQATSLSNYPSSVELVPEGPAGPRSPDVLGVTASPIAERPALLLSPAIAMLAAIATA